MTPTSGVQRRPADWLASSGWTYQPGELPRWSCVTQSGPVTTWCEHAGSGWEEWFANGGAVPRSCAAALLADHARWPAPCKLVRLPDGSVACRADVPSELMSVPLEQWSMTGAVAPKHPLDSWAAAFTALVSGRAGPPPEGTMPASAAEELVAALETAGWSASAADGAVRVSMHLPGVYREVSIDVDPAHGTRCWAELVQLGGWPDECRRAATELALDANDRLHLARFVMLAEPDGDRIIVEINLGSAWIPSAWLDVALETVRTAVALTARELTALRDPELALWALAANAA
ncbi:MAG: hypothetical protein HY000_39780 [Planctomycetes bacterium]|nr:hypothetical protein [Planctomycetota bacterium]